MLERLEILFDTKQFKTKTVVIVGLGGVGSYALEAIVRSGIENIVIVDNDKIEKSNLNRQLIALNTNIGEYKVNEAEKRIKEINPNCKVKKIKEFITESNIDLLFEDKPDYLIDAIDTTETKKLIIKKCLKNKVKFISSMGTANKTDPSLLKITDIRKTSYDPIAKIIRKMVRDEKIYSKVMVVSSTERVKNKGKLGSTAYVPSTAGLLCASYVINDIGDSNE